MGIFDSRAQTREKEALWSIEKISVIRDKSQISMPISPLTVSCLLGASGWLQIIVFDRRRLAAAAGDSLSTAGIIRSQKGARRLASRNIGYIFKRLASCWWLSSGWKTSLFPKRLGILWQRNPAGLPPFGLLTNSEWQLQRAGNLPGR